MSEYGVTPDGFVIKRLETIKAEMEDSYKSVFGNSINIDAESPLGQIIGISSANESELWELMEALYNSQYTNTAEGISLNNAVSLVGLKRKPTTKSTISSQLMYGTISTVIPSGTILSVFGNSEARFITDSPVTLVAGTDEIQTITFSSTPTSGNFTLKYKNETTSTILSTATNTDVQNTINNLNALSGVIVTGSFAAGFTITFAGNDGKQNHPNFTINTNTLDAGGAVTVTVTETIAGVPQGETTMTAESYGALHALSGTLTEIETAISGLDSTKNTDDAIVGQAKESDTDLKIRKDLSLAVPGHTTIDDIRAELLQINGVTNVSIFENDTNTTDGDGRPPKSYECIVLGGDEQVIADKIWKTKPGGIETISTASGGDNISKTVIDSQGLIKIVNFSRPTSVLIYIELDITADATFPDNGNEQIRNAIVNYGSGLSVGDDVIVYPKLISSMNDIAGITDIVVRIGTSPSPTTDNNVVININEIASILSTNILITNL